jgi:hypothetical protein
VLFRPVDPEVAGDECALQRAAMQREERHEPLRSERQINGGAMPFEPKASEQREA